jgi:hypothetical protein
MRTILTRHPQAVTALALALAVVSLAFGLTRASAADVDNLSYEIDVQNMSGASWSDVRDLSDRLDALEADLQDAESAIADLGARADEAAVAAKVDAMVDDLYGSIGSLSDVIDDLCARVDDVSAALEGSDYFGLSYGC